jgi:hypothetical protein
MSPVPHITPTLSLITQLLTSLTRHYAQRECGGGKLTPGNPRHSHTRMFAPLTRVPGTWGQLGLAILDGCRPPISTPISADSPDSPRDQ